MDPSGKEWVLKISTAAKEREPELFGTLEKARGHMWGKVLGRAWITERVLPVDEAIQMPGICISAVVWGLIRCVLLVCQKGFTVNDASFRNWGILNGIVVLIDAGML